LFIESNRPSIGLALNQAPSRRETE
jgi:hypothetical protein